MSVDATGKHIVKMIIILLRLVMLIVTSPGPKRDTSQELERLLMFCRFCRVRSAEPGLRELALEHLGRAQRTPDPSRYVGRVPPKADPSGPQGGELWN